jgi:hypothetical protein
MNISRSLLRQSAVVLGVFALTDAALAVSPEPGTCRDTSRYENQNGIKVLCHITECTPEVSSGGFAPIPVVEKRCDIPDTGPTIPGTLQFPPLGPGGVLPGGGGTTAPGK